MPPPHRPLAGLWPQVLFHTSGICLLTVVINGVSMRKLIAFLGYNKSNEAKQMMQTHGLNRLAKAGSSQEESLKRNALFTSVVWHEAQRFYAGPPRKKEAGLELISSSQAAPPAQQSQGAEGSPEGRRRSVAFGEGSKEASKESTKRETTRRGSDFLRRRTQTVKASRCASPLPPSLSLCARLRRQPAGRPLLQPAPPPPPLYLQVPTNAKEVRRRILMICKQSYKNQLEKGLINRNAATYLRTLCDLCMDRDCALLEWGWICGVLHLEVEEEPQREGGEAEGEAALEVRRSQAQSKTKRAATLARMDSLAWTLTVVGVAAVSCAINLSADDVDAAGLRTVRLVFDYLVMIFFTLEVLVRCACKGSLQRIVRDLYCVVDILVVLLDLTATLVSEVLTFGDTDLSSYSTVPRLIRLLRLLRLLRVLRLASVLKERKHRNPRSTLGATSTAGGEPATVANPASWLAWLRNHRWALWARRRMQIAQYRFAYNVRVQTASAK